MTEVDEEALREIKTERNILIMFILNNAASKLPIKNADLLEVVGKNARLLKRCMPYVVDSLKNVYGCILSEVEDNKSNKRYICHAVEPAKSIHQYSPEQKSEITLLYLILAFIFMSGKSVYEAQLETFLKGLKIFYDQDHSYFGDVRKLINETFVRQLYLTKEKSDSEFDNEAKFLIGWGFRAVKEFKKSDVLEITAKIMGKPSKFFAAQYSVAYEGEEEE